MAGIANIVLSKRSRIPPCPGIIFPESLTPRVRFMSDSIRSPHVPNATTTAAKPIHSIMDSFSKKWAKTKEEPTAKIAPPIYPSNDFLGDIRSNNRCLPKAIPMRKAQESFTQMNTSRASIYTQ